MLQAFERKDRLAQGTGRNVVVLVVCRSSRRSPPRAEPASARRALNHSRVGRGGGPTSPCWVDYDAQLLRSAGLAQFERPNRGMGRARHLTAPEHGR